MQLNGMYWSWGSQQDYESSVISSEIFQTAGRWCAVFLKNRCPVFETGVEPGSFMERSQLFLGWHCIWMIPII